MFKSSLALFSFLLISLGVINTAIATPADTLVQELGNSVLRVQVKLADGKRGLGSAVVVANDELVTNCHVVNGATDITVYFHGEAYVASATKSDWRHDLCMLKVTALDAPVVHMGSTKSLTHETAIFTVGYPGETKSPINTFGVVKGMFPMDGSMVMRASTPFNLGASGGGAFDDAGNLVGIITLKSKGSDAQYFYMPVEWVQSLMKTPTESLSATSKKPFWASAEQERPYFMRVVHPYQNKDWDNLLAIAQEWCSREPNAAESWFYLASAEFAKNDLASAEAHFQQVLALDNSHLEASEYLSKITAKMEKMKLASN